MSIKHGMKHLEAIRASIKVFAGGLVGNGKLGKRRRMSAAGRLAISKATKARWGKVRRRQGEASSEDLGGWQGEHCEGDQVALG